MRKNSKTVSVEPQGRLGLIVKTVVAAACVAAVCASSSARAAAVTFAVTPSTVSNTYGGSITLSISNLNSGETVVVQKFLDANANSVVDASDWLEQQFQLTDGQASVIGGVTNVNVPGDSTPTDGTIIAQMNLQASGFEQLVVGKYAYKLSSPTGRFAAITNLFSVTNAAYAQSFTGKVVSAGVNVSNAWVLLFPGSVMHSSPQAGVVADNAGSYAIKVAAGTYGMVAFKTNFVTDLGQGAPVIPLGVGATVGTNLSLLGATQNISGRIVDAANTNLGLGGFLVFFQTTNGLMGVGFTDTNGNFKVRVNAGQWRVQNNSDQLAAYGYLGLQNRQTVDTTTGSKSNVTIALPKGTALVYGVVTNDLGLPLPGVSLYASDDSNQYEGSATTDQTGHYVMAVIAGNWYASPDSSSPGYSSYIFSQGNGISISDGQAVQVNFVGKAAPNHISGYVSNNTSQAVANVGVYAYATLNGTTFNQYANADGTGYYTINVANGSWHVGLNCSGGNDSLNSLGYQCVGEQVTNILNNNAVVSFTVQPCPPLQVTTPSPLSDGQVNSYYDIQLQAAGCSPSFNWSLAPGSAALPPGLNLNSSGELFGTPTNSGIFNFTVRVTDNSLATADQPLSLTISSQSLPLQVTTSSLPDGTNGAFYTQQLQASGGQTPYSWRVPDYSADLPANLTLATNGVLSGTLAANGTFYFDVEVDDAAANAAYQTLSLTIVNPPLPPLVITNVSLPNGNVGAFYSAQLGATGGQQPYQCWSLALGSASLPPGLSLDCGGLISGTPTTNKVSTFKVQAMDANFTTTNRILSITINPKPVLSAPAWLTNRFQMRLTGTTGQNYTVQVSTNLSSTDWISLLITNSAATNSFNVVDPGATNSRRFYRVMIGP